MRGGVSSGSATLEPAKHSEKFAGPIRPPQPPPPTARLAGPQSLETYIAILSAACIATHLVLRYLTTVPRSASLLPLFLTLIVGGVPLIITLLRKLMTREFGSDLLAGISILSSVLLEQYLVGSIIVLMLSGGEALEHYATRRASSILDALARRMPHIAHRKQESVITDVSLDDIKIGDVLIIFPHEICPVDGMVVEGHGLMDESYLTGEPYEMSKTPGSKVLSGAINGDTALTITAEKLAVDSRYAKIMQVMQETEQKRPRLRRLGDRLGAWYTPVAVGIALLTWVGTDDPLRFLAVVVIATPCPLLIAIPIAVIGAISLAARHGIIIKNAAVLEQITTCRTLIFDKTGTLTYGKPFLTGMVCASGFSEQEVLRKAASLEQYSKHPLAVAILTAAHAANVFLESVSHVSEIPGQGLEGVVDGHNVRITGRHQISLEGKPLPEASGLECVILIDDVYAATLHFHDSPRTESRPFLTHLQPSHGVQKIMLVSGDRESEVRYLANQVGISEVHARQSPEQKVAIVIEETRRDRTLFVGDGINDAPALIAASVGVAFGPNSDITSEAADAVILSSTLGKVDELFHISGRMRRIALQSALGGMAVSLVGMAAAAMGYLPALHGAIAQEVIDLAAVLNAVRVALPGKAELADFAESASARR